MPPMNKVLIGGNKIKAEDPPKVKGGQQTDYVESTKGEASPAGMDRYMTPPAGTFKLSGGGGAPTVADGGWNNGMGGGADTNAEVTTETSFAIGTKVRPKSPGNIYWSGDPVKSFINKQ